MKNFLCLCFFALFTTLPLTGFRTAEIDSDKEGSMLSQDNATMEVTDFIMVKASYYNPVISQCDSTPLITASGATIDTLRTTELHWCAISYNLHKRYGGFLQFGDVIEIEGYQGKKKIKGKYIVHDLMNPAWTNKIDILRGTGERSITFDSVKLKHPKIKQFKTQMAEKIKYTANAIKRQALYQSINKMLFKIPYVGSNADVLKHDNFKERICSIDQTPRNNVSLVRSIIRRNA